MKFKFHLLIELFIFIIAYSIFGIETSLVITLFHFIPSIDLLMIETNFLTHLHLQFFHNIFVMIIAALPVFYFTNLMIGSFAIMNFLLHMTMDLNDGVMIFYPISKYTLKIK